MVTVGTVSCPICTGVLKFHNNVKRIVRSKNRESKWIDIRRLQCSKCGTIHRELPYFLIPYKQYESEVIQGVVEGFITPETLGYEDYPCEMTMIRWRSQNSQSLL